MYLTILLLLVFVAVFASLLRDGLWSNTITLFSALIAAVLATNYFEPLARFFTGLWASAIHFYDILAIALLFAALYVGLRALTTRLSRYRMRFHPLMDNIGGVLMAAWVGWIAVCFTCFALHLAPLTRNFLNGGFDPEQHMFFGLSPDRKWIGFVRGMSDGGSLGRNVTDGEKVTSKFDPDAELLYKYASRRAWFDAQPSSLVQ